MLNRTIVCSPKVTEGCCLLACQLAYLTVPQLEAITTTI